MKYCYEIAMVNPRTKDIEFDSLEFNGKRVPDAKVWKEARAVADLDNLKVVTITEREYSEREIKQPKVKG